MSNDKGLDFVVQVFEAQMKFDQSLTNNLIASGWAEAEEVMTDFYEMCQAIEKVNDSIKVDRILSQFFPYNAENRIRHFRNMKEKFLE